jgi:hypothetical protein
MMIKILSRKYINKLLYFSSAYILHLYNIYAYILHLYNIYAYILHLYNI